jgi:hypothetical protein
MCGYSVWTMLINTGSEYISSWFGGLRKGLLLGHRSCVQVCCDFEGVRPEDLGLEQVRANKLLLL